MGILFNEVNTSVRLNRKDSDTFFLQATNEVASRNHTVSCPSHMCLPRITFCTPFIWCVYTFFNWVSLRACLNSHYEAWNYQKKKYKKIKAYLRVNLFKRCIYYYLPAAKYISNCVLMSLLPMILRASLNVLRSSSLSSILHFRNKIATSSPVSNSESWSSIKE